jgi:antitoxin component YwqK of YwqJK toxin-antitoxin module
MTLNKILFFLTLFVFSNCQNAIVKEVNLDEINLLPNRGIFVYHDVPFTGIAVDFYTNSKQLKSRITFKEGKKDGLYELFFVDGKASQTTFYQNGKRFGESKTWWKDGALRSVSNFENDKAQGVQEQFYKEGMIFKRFNLNNGREEGLQQAWRKNGDIYVNYEAKNGRNFGLKRAGLCYELQEEEILKD